MQIENCDFPDALRYGEEGLVWLRPDPSGDWTLGATSILVALAGPLVKVTGKPASVAYARGKAVGTLESGRYFGAIRTPVEATLLEVNPEVLRRPRGLSEDPYGRGWFARLRIGASAEANQLPTAPKAKEVLARQIASLRVHCFAAFPDHEMFEIGTECAAVITKLDDVVAQASVGDVVHLVSDDWTAPAEMENWCRRTGNALIETRREGNLFHFLVRKAPSEGPTA